MPAQFDSFGVRFLYPDNWTVGERTEEEGDDGVTLDVPGGGFVSVEKTQINAVDKAIDEIVRVIAAEYEDLERESVSRDVLPAETQVTDLRFYYLDLVIISRIVVLTAPTISIGDGEVLMVQIQAESRDFDKNESVFDAILKQIVS